jgi:GNAT superfamily N-acetyltransferase
MNMNIRPATLDDIPALRRFEAALVEHERAVEPTIKQEGPLEYYDLEALIQDTRKAVVLIVEIDGAPVGCGLGQIRENLPSHKESHYGYVGLMYTAPEHRGKGVASGVVQTLKQWFQLNHIRSLHLQVYANNAEAMEAYKHLGFVSYIVEMRLEI